MILKMFNMLLTMKKRFPIVVLLLLVNLNALFTSDVKIIKIIMPDIVQLESGEIVKLAHVDSPEDYANDSLKSYIYNKAIKYFREIALNKKIGMIKDKNYHSKAIHLIRKYTLNSINYNQRMLKKGYGYYSETGILYSEKNIPGLGYMPGKTNSAYMHSRLNQLRPEIA